VGFAAWTFLSSSNPPVMMEVEKQCTMLIAAPQKTETSDIQDLQKKIESNKVEDKTAALEELIILMANGEAYPKMLMVVIRFVLTQKDHRLKKLLMLYWELVEKTVEGSNELREEMILVVNALRNDLTDPNEFVRGSTMRLLTKMKYARILDGLIEPIVRNLSHRHSYVRRNAVMCIFAIVKTFGSDMIPGVTEEVEQVLLSESDISTKRNAFLMLAYCDQDKAVNYVLTMHDQISGIGDITQLAALELVRRVCRASHPQKNKLLRIIFDLSAESSNAVGYECAASLVTLSNNPVAVDAAVKAYVQLLNQQADNNVKLIVLDRLFEIRAAHKAILEQHVMDIMRALSSPSIAVRRKVLDICLGPLVTEKNSVDVVSLLKKEIVKTMESQAKASDGNTEYRRLVIRALHACIARFPQHAESVIFILVDFLSDEDKGTATDVLMFIRELVAHQTKLRGPILGRLAESLPEVSNARVLGGCLWLVGEYCDENDQRSDVLNSILEAVSPLPLIEDTSAEADQQKKPDEKSTQATTRTVIGADGSYVTETVYSSVKPAADDKKQSALRKHLLKPDLLLASMVGTTVTKMSLRDIDAPLSKKDPSLHNRVLFLVVNLLKLARDHGEGGKTSDSALRLTQCVRAMVSHSAASKMLVDQWRQGGRDALIKVLQIEAQTSSWYSADVDTANQDEIIAPDRAIRFRQLREGRTGATTMFDEDEGDLKEAAGGQSSNFGKDFAERLAKAVQMTGTADPVYVEAFLKVHTFDVHLELLLVNRTAETLQNVLVELNSGSTDLEFVDRPAPVTLAPLSSQTVTASIKVSSTETGVIFGYVTYERNSATDKDSIILNEIHIDVLDYIEKAWIGELSFRTMWAEFEWENKININTTMTDVRQYLVHVMLNTNLCVVGRSTPSQANLIKDKKSRMTREEAEAQLDEAIGQIQESSFVALNLYSKSIFAEDALANVSIEKTAEGKLQGSVRIRSRTQGIALSLGDRLVQKGMKK